MNDDDFRDYFRNWEDSDDNLPEREIPEVKSLDKFDAKYLKCLRENWSIFKIEYFDGKEFIEYADKLTGPDIPDHRRITKLTTIVHMKLDAFDVDLKWNFLYLDVHRYWYLYYKIEYLKKYLKKH